MNIGSLTHKYISTNATTVVKSSAGFLHSITIGTAGASANTITVYDNTAGEGTVIAVLDGVTGALSGAPVNFVFDVCFKTGLTIVTATGTAAKITVSYN